MPAGVEETGKNGAIPDPVVDASARAHVFCLLVLLDVQTSIAKLRVLLHGEQACVQRYQKRGEVEE
jgi:hypothetical protein